MKRYVIYSAMVGAYDYIQQPLLVDDRFDYVLFTNEVKESVVGVWQIKSIDYQNNDNTRVCRYIKTHPEVLLDNYDASLWLDANISIKGKEIYDRFIELVENDVLVASVKHLAYDCVYDEMLSVLDFRYESEEIVVKWGHELRKRQFPKHAGMFETGLMFRKHSSAEVKMLDTLWWKYIESYSKRDQLSFTVALQEVHLSCKLFLPEGKTVRDSAGLYFVKHKNESIKIDLNEKPAWLMHHYYKHHEDKDKVAKLYYWSYGRRNPRLWVAVFGWYYRIKDVLLK